jgi:hypothetical protein
VQNRRNVQVGCLAQTRTVSCITRVLVWLGGFHIGTAGIRNREKRVANIVVRELKRAKPGAWGCIQAHEVWSTGVRVAGQQVQVGGVQGHQVLPRGQCPRR